MRFNGLEPRILDMIVDEEAKRIGVDCVKHVDWERISGERAYILTWGKGEIIHISNTIKAYCTYIYSIRHELFHIKHLRMVKLVAKLRVLRYILRRLIIEFPARRYAQQYYEAPKVFCKGCPAKGRTFLS